MSLKTGTVHVSRPEAGSALFSMPILTRFCRSLQVQMFLVDIDFE